MPVFFFETGYENERGADDDSVRGQFYASVAGCSAGFFTGVDPIWHFGGGWQRTLSSRGSQQLGIGRAIVEELRWWELVADPSLRGALGDVEALAARTADGRQAIFSLAEGEESVRVRLSRLQGPLDALFYDPTNFSVYIADRKIAASGEREFRSPGRNAAGDGDWVLVLLPSAR